MLIVSKPAEGLSVGASMSWSILADLGSKGAIIGFSVLLMNTFKKNCRATNNSEVSPQGGEQEIQGFHGVLRASVLTQRELKIKARAT